MCIALIQFFAWLNISLSLLSLQVVVVTLDLFFASKFTIQNLIDGYFRKIINFVSILHRHTTLYTLLSFFWFHVFFFVIFIHVSLLFDDFRKDDYSTENIKWKQKLSKYRGNKVESKEKPTFFKWKIVEVMLTLNILFVAL